MAGGGGGAESKVGGGGGENIFRVVEWASKKKKSITETHLFYSILFYSCKK